MYRILILAFLLTITGHVSAQTGMYQVWETEYSNDIGRTDKEFNAVCAHSSGGLMVGKSSSQLGVTMYAAKYQLNGQLLWDVFLSTPKQSTLTKVVKDAQGDYYVVGTEIIGALFNERQLNIAKISNAGQVIWRTTYRGPLGTFVDISDLKISGGHLYMCGEIITNIPATGEAWVAKFDLAGSFVWDKLFSPGIPVEFVKLAIDNAGSVTAVGNADFSDSFLAVQYSSSGMLNWTYPTAIVGGDEKYLTDVAVDNNGNVYVTGTEETGFFVVDIVTIKLDNMGAEVWKRNYTNNDTNSGGTIELGSNGNIYSFGNKETASVFSIYAVAYDAAGTMQWSTDYSLDGGSTVVDSEIDSNGDLYIAVQDDDSIGVVKFSSSGAVQGDKAYSDDDIDDIYDISIAGTDLYGVGYENKIGTGFSLASNSLNENFFVAAQGLPLSDENPGDIVNDGNNLWVSSFGTDGDSAIYTIRKTDLAGNLLWKRSKRYKSSIPKFPYLQVDGSGNIYGLFEIRRNIFGGNLGLVKYDGAGNEMFTLLLDSADVYTVGGLALSGSGDIYISGYKASTIKKMFLSRYNSSGVFQWTTTYTSPASSPYSIPYEMRYSAQGKIVISAIHRAATNSNDLHVFQYSNSGALEWHMDAVNQAGGTVNFAGMHVEGNGDVIISGSSGIGKYVTAKLSSSGAVLWADTSTSPVSGAIRSIAVDSQGKTYVCFSTNSHVWVRLLSSAGALINDDQFSVPGSVNFYFPWKSTVINDKLVILGQYSMVGGGVPFEMIIDDQLQLNYVNIDSATVAKCELITVDPTGHPYGVYLTGDLGITNSYRGTLLRKFELGTVNVESISSDEMDILVFPNPTVGQINVSLNLSSSCVYQFNIYNLQGKRIAELAEKYISGTSTTEVFNIPSVISNGTYFLEMRSADASAVCKFSILR